MMIMIILFKNQTENTMLKANAHYFLIKKTEIGQHLRNQLRLKKVIPSWRNGIMHPFGSLKAILKTIKLTLLCRYLILTLPILIQTKANQLSNIKNEFIMILVYLIAYIFICVICGVGYVLIQHGLILVGFIVEFISFICIGLFYVKR